ncbi:MAG: sensor histidine kinase [Eubacterium sp.]
MGIFCSVIADILHILGILLMCKYYLQLREKNTDRYRYLKIFIISIVFSLIINMIENQTIALIIYLLYIGIIMQVCYLEDYRKILICAIWVSIIVEIIDMISILLVNTVSTIINYHNGSNEKILGAVLSLGFISSVAIFLRRITGDGIRNVNIRDVLLFTVILFADLFILVLMTNVTLEEMAYKNKVVYIAAYTSVTIGLFIQMESVILLLVSRNMYKEKELIIKQYLEEQVKQYEYMNEREKETKKFRHDIRGHLYFLNKLKREGKNQEFEEYFGDIIDRVDDLGDSINVGNDIVNAVLNKAYAEAESKNINMNVTGHFPSKCNISAYNLCTIFFNLLNNAIEATDKTTKREIWVVCQYTEKEIIVEIGNYYCINNQLDKNSLQTTKNEKECHGWGMKNVEDSVVNCKGLMDIEIVDDKFIVSLTLKKEKEDIVK